MTVTDMLSPLKNQLDAALAKIATLQEDKQRLLVAVGEEVLKVQATQEEAVVLRHRLEEERAGHSAILAVLDDVERMRNALKEEYDGTWVYDGAGRVYSNFEKALSRLGIEKITCEPGHLFDPNFHEALAVAPGDKGVIVSVVRAGYTYKGGNVIQPVGVVVGGGA